MVINEKGNYSTREGLSVRVVCVDKAGTQGFPIVALVEVVPGVETLFTYSQKGRHNKDGSPSPLDLFLKEDV